MGSLKNTSNDTFILAHGDHDEISDYLRIQKDADLFFAETGVPVQMPRIDAGIFPVTQLRHPHDRWISHLRHTLHDINPELANLATRNLSAAVIAFARNHDPLRSVLEDNLMTRFFAGPQVGEYVTKQDYIRAVHNLRRMHVVVLERMPLSWLILADLLGVNRDRIVRTGTFQQDRMPYAHLTSEAAAIVVKQNTWDLKLYLHGVAMFERLQQNWALMRAGQVVAD